jgi:hypothetical protein
MKGPEIRYAVLAASLAFVASVAIAQSNTAPSSNNDTYARPVSHTIGEPPARDFGAESRGRTSAPVNGPTNVLEEPRDLRDEQPRTWCTNDPLTGKMAVDCRRWSEIASSQGVALQRRSET